MQEILSQFTKYAQYQVRFPSLSAAELLQLFPSKYWLLLC